MCFLLDLTFLKCIYIFFIFLYNNSKLGGGVEYKATNYCMGMDPLKVYKGIKIVSRDISLILGFPISGPRGFWKISGYF